MPHKKGIQIGLATLEKVAGHEGKKSREQQKYHNEDISDGR